MPVEAKAVMRADNRRLRSDLAISKRAFGRAFSTISRGIRTRLSGALGALGIGAAAFGLGAIGKEALGFEQTLLDLDVQAGATDEQMAGLRQTIGALSGEYAMNRDILAAAALELVNLQGQAGLSSEKLRVLTRTAFATHAPVNQLAGLVFSLQNAFGLKTPAELEEGLAAVVTAGKFASVPLSEMNLVLQQISSDFSEFTASGQVGAAELAASIQILRNSFGSAAEAGTGLKSLLALLATREIELGKAGIDVKDAAGNFRDLDDIVKDIDMSGVLDDAAKMKAAFGKKYEARKALKALIKEVELLEKIKAAAQSTGNLQDDIDERRASRVHKINQAFVDMKERIFEAITPERIAAFAAVLEKAAEVVGFMVENAELFVAAWMGLKLIGIMRTLRSMLITMEGLKGASILLQGGIAGVATAAGLAGAAFAGWSIGRIIDEAFGLSDMVADLQNQLLQSRQDVAGAKFEGMGFFKMAGYKGGALPAAEQERIRRRATRVMQSAREAGLVTPGGRALGERGISRQLIKGGMERKAAPAEAVELQRSIAMAREILAHEQRINVTISVDKEGLLTAKKTEEQAAARSTSE